MSSDAGRFRSIARIDQVYYTAAHGNGNPTERAILIVGRDVGAAEVAGPSVLHAAERAPRRPGLRSVGRRQVQALLREGHGASESAPWALLPAAAGRLFRGHRL